MGESFSVAAGFSRRLPWPKGILRKLKLAVANAIQARFRADNWFQNACRTVPVLGGLSIPYLPPPALDQLIFSI